MIDVGAKGAHPQWSLHSKETRMIDRAGALEMLDELRDSVGLTRSSTGHRASTGIAVTEPPSII
jgi:hypothetical protein